MKIIEPSYEIIHDGIDTKEIEKAARTCYKSEDKITDGSDIRMIKAIISAGHEAMLEHSFLSVKFICDRAVANEIVRHRLFSFAQESTRYCNYSKDKFGGDITVILPCYLKFVENSYKTSVVDTKDGVILREQDSISMAYKVWEHACQDCESAYFKLLDIGLLPEEARAVLPMSLKTELVVSGNVREWRHFLKLRTAKDAHIQMRELTIPLLRDLKTKHPYIFDDIEA